MTKSLPLVLLVSAGLLSSTATASAKTYGLTVVNGVTYNLSPYADLFRADLYNADLTYANLSHADLSQADLFNSNLSYANLSYALLTYTDLPFTNLSGANLSYANLSYADLSGANLSNANLTGAKLIGAHLGGANLTGATLSYSNFLDLMLNSGARYLGSHYTYDTSLINYANASVPEPSTYGLIGIGALGVAFAARRKKQKSV